MTEFEIRQMPIKPAFHRNL